MPIFNVSTLLDSKDPELGDAVEPEFDEYVYGPGLGVRGVVIARDGGCAFDSELAEEMDFVARRATTTKWISRGRRRADGRRQAA